MPSTFSLKPAHYEGPAVGDAFLFFGLGHTVNSAVRSSLRIPEIILVKYSSSCSYVDIRFPIFYTTCRAAPPPLKVNLFWEGQISTTREKVHSGICSNILTWTMDSSRKTAPHNATPLRGLVRYWQAWLTLLIACHLRFILQQKCAGSAWPSSVRPPHDFRSTLAVLEWHQLFVAWLPSPFVTGLYEGIPGKEKDRRISK